jgi:quinol monooxygenase YgiN
MFGTVAKLKVKPGSDDKMKSLMRQYDDLDIEGFVADYVFRSEDEPNVYYLAVAFEDRDTYVANAESPGQHKRFEALSEILAEPPEWNDGEIVYSVAS